MRFGWTINQLRPAFSEFAQSLNKLRSPVESVSGDQILGTQTRIATNERGFFPTKSTRISRQQQYNKNFLVYTLQVAAPSKRRAPIEFVCSSADAQTMCTQLL